MEIPKDLRESVWHTTTPKRYEKIVETGHLLPEPSLPDSERWATSMGRDYYPYVRSIRGVSLFDFRGIDGEKYCREFRSSSLSAFVPCKLDNDSAIWIEMNLLSIKKNFISGKLLRDKMNSSGEHRRKFMPLIEAAHIGPISTSAFLRVLIYDKSNDSFTDFEGAGELGC